MVMVPMVSACEFIDGITHLGNLLTRVTKQLVSGMRFLRITTIQVCLQKIGVKVETTSGPPLADTEQTRRTDPRSTGYRICSELQIRVRRSTCLVGISS